MWNIWILIPLVAIIGGLYLEFQKNKMSMMKLGRDNEEEVDELRKYVDKLKTRIENLEAIAAGAPDDFKAGAGTGVKEIEIGRQELKEENKEETSKISNDLKVRQWVK